MVQRAFENRVLLIEIHFTYYTIGPVDLKGVGAITEKELSQLYWLNREIGYMEKKLERLRSQAEYSAPILSHTPRGGKGKSLEDYAVEITDLEKLLAIDLEKRKVEIARLERFISKIYDSRLRMIFRLRHVEGYSWVRIGNEMGYTYEGVRKLYKKELKKLK